MTNNAMIEKTVATKLDLQISKTKSRLNVIQNAIQALECSRSEIAGAWLAKEGKPHEMAMNFELEKRKKELSEDINNLICQKNEMNTLISQLLEKKMKLLERVSDRNKADMKLMEASDIRDILEYRASLAMDSNTDGTA